MASVTMSRTRGGNLRRVLLITLAALLAFATLSLVPAAPGVPGAQRANATHPDADPGTVPNPNLGDSCGGNLVLVMDSSGSIGSAGGVGSIKAAYNALLNGLLNTGSSAAVIDFDEQTNTGLTVPMTAITDASVNQSGGLFKNYIDNDYLSDGWTNWQDALQDARAEGPASLFVFLTDGNPNTAIGHSGGQPGLPGALWAGQTQANLIKGDGSHILAVGVGSNVTLSALRAVTDGASSLIAPPAGVNASTIQTLDIITSSFGDLEQAFRDLADALCAPAVALDKTVDDNSKPEPGGDFNYTLQITNNSPDKEPFTITALTDTQSTDAASFSACAALVGTVVAYGGSVDCNYTVTRSAIGTYPNTADVNVIDDSGRTDSDTDAESVNVTDLLPDISVTKTADPTSVVEPGGNVEYEVGITNNVDEDVTITSIVDDKFGNLATEAAGSGCEVGSTLEANSSCSFTFTETITGDAGDSHTNVVTVDVTDNEQNTDTDTAQAKVTITDLLPDISVTKTADPTFVSEPGGNVTYTVTVTNNRNEAVEITSLTDDKFGNLEGDANCAVGETIPANASCSFEFTEFVGGNAGAEHVNTVTAEVIDNEENVDKAKDDASVAITGIGIDKSSSVSGLSGPGTIQYTIAVWNKGDVTLTKVKITDDLVAIDPDNDCDWPGETGVLPGGDGQQGGADTVTCEVSYTVDQAEFDKGEAVVNTATANSNQTGSVHDSARVNLKTGPSTAIVKSVTDVGGNGPDGVVDTVGQVITYQIVTTNTGNVTLHNVTVTDPLLADLDCDAGTDGNQTSGFTLAPGASLTCTGTYTVTQADLDTNGDGDGDIDNTATAATKETTEVKDSAQVPVEVSGSLTVSKDPSPQLINLGSIPTDAVTKDITWQITVANAGTSALYNVTVSDVFEATPSAECSLDEAEVAALLGKSEATLDVGESFEYECTIAVTFPAVASGGIVPDAQTNVATAAANDPTGAKVDPATDSALVVPVIVSAAGAIGDTVWNDLNKDGIQDAGEPGIAGAKVTATNVDTSTVLPQQTTNADGKYLFVALPEANYKVELDLSSVSGKLTTPGSFTFFLADNEQRLDADFGLFEELPVTGIDTEQLMLMALALLLAGAVVLLATRRRKGRGTAT